MLQPRARRSRLARLSGP